MLLIYPISIYLSIEGENMNINSLESHADWCAWSKNLDALPYKAAKVVFQEYKKMYCQYVKPFSDLLFQTDYLHS